MTKIKDIDNHSIDKSVQLGPIIIAGFSENGTASLEGKLAISTLFIKILNAKSHSKTLQINIHIYNQKWKFRALISGSFEAKYKMWMSTDVKLIK